MTPAYSKAMDLHRPATYSGVSRSVEETIAFRSANQIRASLTQDDWAEKVLAFRKLYRLPLPDAIGPLGVADARLHMMMLQEEVDETSAALIGGDVVESVDGLLDVIYVAIGALLHLGLSSAEIRDCMQEVHASNLTKVDSNGQPVYDLSGKVQKGANYVKADLSPVLTRRAVEQQKT